MPPFRAILRRVFASVFKKRAMSSQVKYQFSLVPFSEPIYREYARWHQIRQMPLPPQPVDSLWIGYGNELVAGVCLYECAQMFLIAENLVTNPGAPPKIAHAAISLGLDVLRAVGAQKGKVVICCASRPSLARLLARKGYQARPVAVMALPPAPIAMFTQEPPQKPARVEKPRPRQFTEQERPTAPDVPIPQKKGSRKSRADSLLGG